MGSPARRRVPPPAPPASAGGVRLMPPRILGPDGRPVAVPARDLARRLAPPAPLGLRRTQQWQAVAPLLTPWRLRQIEAAVAQGTWCPEFFELAEELEERDLHYRGVLQQRRLRSAGAPLDVVPASDARADIALAAEIREQVVEGPGFHDVLLDLLDALGKGIACVEVVWEVLSKFMQVIVYKLITGMLRTTIPSLYPAF